MMNARQLGEHGFQIRLLQCVMVSRTDWKSILRLRRTRSLQVKGFKFVGSFLDFDLERRFLWIGIGAIEAVARVGRLGGDGLLGLVDNFFGPDEGDGVFPGAGAGLVAGHEVEAAGVVGETGGSHDRDIRILRVKRDEDALARLFLEEDLAADVLQRLAAGAGEAAQRRQKQQPAPARPGESKRASHDLFLTKPTTDVRPRTLSVGEEGVSSGTGPYKIVIGLRRGCKENRRDPGMAWRNANRKRAATPAVGGRVAAGLRFYILHKKGAGDGSTWSFSSSAASPP